MKITFLGTGTSQGVPMIGSDHPVCLSTDPKDKRLRASIMISWQEENKEYCYTIDCGTDFRQQMLRAKVSKLNAVFFTHEHVDHILGIDDLRPFCYRQGNIPLYGLERVMESIKYRFDYAFQKDLVSVPKLALKPIEAKKEIQLTPNVSITPIEVMHGNLPILAYRWNNIAYLTDVKSICIESLEALKGLDILIINALRIEPHPSHLCLEECLNYIKKIKPKKAYLTHISHLLGFHKEIEKQLPDNIYLAYDELEIII